MARVVTAIVAAVLVIALLGCGDDGETATARIDVQVSGDPEETAVYREVISSYERKTGAQVRLIEIGDRAEHLAKLSTSFAAGRAPDAFLINHRYLGAFAQRRVLDPVGPRLGDRRTRYVPIALEAFTYGGELQCVPQNASSLVVYFNRNAFRRAGVPEPAKDWSYPEFVAAARRLTGDGRHGAVVEPSLTRASAFVWSAGGELVDDTLAPKRFTLDTPAARRGLEALVALRRDGVAPGARELESKGADARFIDGDGAMFLSSRREVPQLRAAIRDFEWDVAAFPVIERPATVLHSDGLCITRAGAPEAAWRFVEFATGPEGQAILARAGRTVPSLRAVARSAAFLEPKSAPRSSRVFLDALEHLHRLPTTANFERVEESADVAIEEAFFGRLSVDEAVRRIADETDGRF